MISVIARRVYIFIIGITLLGYAFFGRSFAYMGIGSFHVDVFIVAAAALVLFLNPGWARLFRLPHVWLLASFMIWGFVRTVPYISVYGLDALRDAVIWAYAIIAIATGYVIIRDNLYCVICRWYIKWFRRFVLWSPIALGLYWLVGTDLPHLPWGPKGGVLFLNPKGGDRAVHLAGVLAFVLLVSPYLRKSKGLHFKDWIFWGAWLLAFIMVSISVRAAFVTVTIAVVILAFHVNPIRWGKVASLLLISLLLFALTGVELDVGHSRKVSFDQLLINMKSIFTNVEEFSGENTKRWRIEWWGTIISYTVYGEYFWTGKGYGINLADADGFQVTKDDSLRSPHNGHLTVLARSGVPGFFLWVSFQIVLATSLWVAYWRNRNKGYHLEAGILLWVFVYYIAAIVNATFDVYLEGPQGGIWFWNIIGLGLGILLGRIEKGNNICECVNVARNVQA